MFTHPMNADYCRNPLMPPAEQILASCPATTDPVALAVWAHSLPENHIDELFEAHVYLEIELSGAHFDALADELRLRAEQEISEATEA